MRDSIRLAESILVRPEALALELERPDRDPFGLNLPPITGSGGSSLTPDAGTLKVMATLYLQAELEQAGVVAVAEVLSGERYQLTIYSDRTAGLLEEFARRKRDWPDRRTREQIFGRVFGFGSLGSLQESSLTNRDFQTKLAAFCLEIRRIAMDLRWRNNVSPMLEAGWRQTAVDLLVNLGERRYGDLSSAARRIQEQLSSAITLLSDEGLGQAFGTRGMWSILRAVLGDNTPDFARLTTRGQSGLHLLNWLATVLPAISDKNPQRRILEGGSPVFGWAESWLTATGFDAAGSNPAMRRAA